MADNFFDLAIRDMSRAPPGDNATDTIFGDHHLSLTILKFFNYTYYPINQTVSNDSHCYLTFKPYEPAYLYENGTFINATWCWSATEPIRARGYTGIGGAILYGIGLVLTMSALAKHGALYLPASTRFTPIGRRWQWYWGCFVCACALISLLTNIDVDRYHVQELPIVLTTFFWFLICQGTMALVWEAVRHWGSWLERQYIDPDPFVYRQDDRRAMVEFWMPLWFYFWVWMNFFLVVPRNWNFAELQRSPEQTLSKAIPTATGGRFKAAGFCLVIAWLTILFSMRHSIKYYKPRNRGLWNRMRGLVSVIPLRFQLMIPLALALIAYQIFIAFEWKYSIIRYDGIVPVIYGWGYGPPLLIVYIQIIYGYVNPNEDKELTRQRRVRGETINHELGIVQKPAWWRRVRGDHLGTLRDKIRGNVKEVGGKRGIGRRAEDDMERHVREEAERAAINDDDIEMGRVVKEGLPPVRNSATSASLIPSPMPYTGKSERRRSERAFQAGAGILFPNEAEARRARQAAYLLEEDSPPPYADGQSARASTRPQMGGARTSSTSTTSSTAGPPQQVRSMLDV
ncbi:hypothetical protein HIM_07229 [Hirsutella minnesotensis 3608]|uniref:Uncharacterized protein n=1 Tax=Hirsutella minnesotensis 3608 TaxID=1043627 RepID=A0A0F7ZNB0_9HYPO|nr:hypothetical protein HIM_07229 [Hirsutella minnesotensis 3608]